MDTRAEADARRYAGRAMPAAAIGSRGGAAAMADAMLPKMLAPATLSRQPEIVERVRGLMARTPVAGHRGRAGGNARPGRAVSPCCPTLAGVPTLVVAGEADVLTPPEQARAMAQAIPGARLAIIPEPATSRRSNNLEPPPRSCANFCARFGETFCPVGRSTTAAVCTTAADGCPSTLRLRDRGQAVRSRGSFFDLTRGIDGPLSRRPSGEREAQVTFSSSRSLPLRPSPAAYRC